MPRSRSEVSVTFHRFPKNPDYERLVNERVVDRARAIDRQAREQGLHTLELSSDPLVPIGVETNGSGLVTKNGYGVLHLPWLAQENPGWADQIGEEVSLIAQRIRDTHGLRPRYVIWAGMGGSAEDKAFYLSAGLMGRRIKLFILDSTDPAKLAAILDRIVKLEGQPLEQSLKRVLVVGMAMGMTSYEPVMNLEKLDALYRKLGIENRPNFLYMTLPGSILDQFGAERGFRRVELQPDGGNSTAGRHSGPLTRGSLYPLALAGVDLHDWMRGAALSDDEVSAALRLAGFIQGNARQGRDKVVWRLPVKWRGGGVWTKQDFEESLGKSEEIGVKVVVNEPIRLADYYSPKSPEQDRCFVVVNVAGLRNPDAAKVAALKRAGYPVAAIQLGGSNAVARYMQFVHYTVFGLGCVRNMNFVTQPGVELYKEHASKIFDEAAAGGGIEKTAAWRNVTKSRHRLRWMGGLTVDFGPLVRLGLLQPEELDLENGNAPVVFAAALEKLRAGGQVTYGELTFFGDTRYQAGGPSVLRTLEKAGAALFRGRLKMPVDVYEGPAMNHSYHEMIIGFGHGFSTVAIADQQTTFRKADYRPDYHRAQWLATLRALEERGRAVVALTIRDLGDASLKALADFFAEAARRVKKRRG